jgi:hypothetical protein
MGDLEMTEWLRTNESAYYYRGTIMSKNIKHQTPTSDLLDFYYATQA